MGSAKAVNKKPEDVRRESSVNRRALGALEERLRGLGVSMPDPREPNRKSARSLRGLFVTIQENRNEVTKVAGALIPKLSRLRADLVRVEGVIGVESSALIDRGIVSGANAEARRAGVREELRAWHEARDEIAADIKEVEGLLSYAKWIRDELRQAFETASRLLSEIQLEYRISSEEEG